MSEKIALREVGMRDGLQSIATVMPTETKIAWLDAEYAAGVREIEVSSFVPPKLLPQLADAEAISAWPQAWRSVWRSEPAGWASGCPGSWQTSWDYARACGSWSCCRGSRACWPLASGPRIVASERIRERTLGIIASSLWAWVFWASGRTAVVPGRNQAGNSWRDRRSPTSSPSSVLPRASAETGAPHFPPTA